MIWLDLGKKKEIESINVRDLDDLSMRFLTHVFHDGKDKISKQINSIFFLLSKFIQRNDLRIHWFDNCYFFKEIIWGLENSIEGRNNLLINYTDLSD